MGEINFTLRDILGVLLACGLFSFIFLPPGYLAGWLFDILDFRHRLLPARLAISIVLSILISPILAYFSYRLVSEQLAFAIFALIIIGCIVTQMRWHEKILAFSSETRKYIFIALWIGLAWIVLALFSLVDLQIGHRLYETAIAQDYSTRASVIDAITRTGVPPINPGYYPGKPISITVLYYFWYVLCSLVDRAGGVFVTARMAIMASAIWCGYALMALIAVYIRMRNAASSTKTWKMILTGIGLLAVSGLDFIPVSFFMILSRTLDGFVWYGGDMEYWNEQITAWAGSLLWVPHHIASFIACFTGILLLESVRTNTWTWRKSIGTMLIAGLGFASGLGLSIWVTVIFAAFWGIFLIVDFIHQREIRQAVWMIGTGLIAGVAILPFMLDLLRGASASSSSGLPFEFAIRSTKLSLFFINLVPLNLLNLFFLPLNYFLELGLFMIVGLVWWVKIGKSNWRNKRFYYIETLLFLVTVSIVTFLRSTVTENNDFGWRGWLFGQFVLLIWAIDVIQALQQGKTVIDFRFLKFYWSTSHIQKLLTNLLILGVITSLFDLVLLRTWAIWVDQGITALPIEITPDMNLGERTYDARLAYEFINQHLPKDIVIQYNPATKLDRPAGLYRDHQSVVSDHTLYGITQNDYLALKNEFAALFDDKTATAWSHFDESCRRYHAEVIVLKDTDGIWGNLSILQPERKPLYKNNRYAVFECGAE